MNKDIQLIFETYKCANQLQLNEEVMQQLINEGIVDWLESTREKHPWIYTAAQIIDPSGVLSWPDLYQAFAGFNNSTAFRTTLSCLRVILALFMVMPNLGFILGGTAGAAVGAPVGGVGAAPGAGIGAGTGGGVWSIIKAAAAAIVKEAALKVTSKMPGFTKFVNSLSTKIGSILSKKPVTDLLVKYVTQFGTAGKLTPAQIQVLTNAVKTLTNSKVVLKLPSKMKAVGRFVGAGITQIAPNLQDTSSKSTESPFGPQTAQQQFETEIETGQKEMPGAAGVVMVGYDQNGQPIYVPQTQFSTRGGVGYQTDPTTGRRYGVMASPNLQQGATLEQPYDGWETMPPQEYMQPDNFNYPPGYDGPPEASYSPQQYNTYGQYSYSQQPQGGLVGALMQPLLGTIGGGFGGPQGGAYAGAMLNPVNNLGGLASGFLNILPGLAGAM